MEAEKTNHIISYQGHQINYVMQGKGPILLFLHGWPTNALLWQAQMTYFSQKYRTVAIDWLGFGKSDKPTDHHYTFSTQKEILSILIDELLKKEEKISLVAHDIGGPPAILWASENQARVQQFILLNTVLYPFSTPMDQMSHFLFSIPILKSIMASRFGLIMIMHSIGKIRNRSVNRKIRVILNAHIDLKKAPVLQTILEPLKAGKKQEFQYLAAQFKALKINRHLIIAKGDPLCYAHIKKLHEENPAVPADVMEHCGHYIPIEQPEELNALLTKVLGSA
jgi:haloalkane dehalogenase